MLNWNSSISSGVVGYNVYRGSGSGGPYMRLNYSMLPATNYTDSAVQAGQTYYYVVTAINSGNVESDFSKEVAAPIP
jgi:fibronectin type 3 domain-containing protein